MLENVHPLGFLDSHRALDAELLIGKADQIMSALAPTDADLRPAREALSAAKALFAAEAYSKALAQAKRAATIATNLNERFTAYMAAWAVLQDCRKELEQIGFPTSSLDIALASADSETVHQVEEAGTLVPNYLGATAMLDQAAVEARRLVAQARAASHDVFVATLAVEALSDSPSRSVPSWLGVRLEELVERATRELAQGNLPEARRIAMEARARAEGARAGAARAWEILDLAAAVLDGLEASGPRADELAAKLRSVRDALGQGYLDRTTAVQQASRVSSDVAALAKSYPARCTDLERSEARVAQMQHEGFRSDEVGDALLQARQALGRGEWAAVDAKLQWVATEVARLFDEQDRIRKGIAELDHRAALLEEFRLPMLPGVMELLDRAKGDARGWQLPGAQENLELAEALMLQATRTGS